MIWLTMEGKAYIHNKVGMLLVSNSNVLSICAISKFSFAKNGCKISKKSEFFIHSFCVNGFFVSLPFILRARFNGLRNMIK